MKTGRALNQKEAIKKALSYGIVPRGTHDVVPREGAHRKLIMSPQEFENFMERLKS